MILKSAQHASPLCALRYTSDCSTLFEFKKYAKNQTENHVSFWKSLTFEVDTHGVSPDASTFYQKPIIELVNWWYDVTLNGLNKKVPYHWAIKFL